MGPFAKQLSWIVSKNHMLFPIINHEKTAILKLSNVCIAERVRIQDRKGVCIAETEKQATCAHSRTHFN